ncbi:hypothetical protein P171DRAFT_54324 [Karstenula rhodostoma CBS 690.94]|uniref:Uncharacterized protein n=1 Tax=Karstenula rhodostoma CBS 690.94 TaxID=1392251 RepID=A0A9P4PHI0_9PLEO|nr:hypothetical protein P171DRAFT_54324 [Karstenula rhodostoma CBS 690.94]
MVTAESGAPNCGGARDAPVFTCKVTRQTRAEPRHQLPDYDAAAELMTLLRLELWACESAPPKIETSWKSAMWGIQVPGLLFALAFVHILESIRKRDT